MFFNVVPPLTSFRIAQTAEFCITESRNDEIGFRLGSTVPSATPFSNFPAKVHTQLSPGQQTEVQNPENVSAVSQFAASLQQNHSETSIIPKIKGSEWFWHQIQFCSRKPYEAHHQHTPIWTGLHIRIKALKLSKSINISNSVKVQVFI